MVSILFVCDTNTSLSPLVEGIFSKLAKEASLDKQFDLDTAGTFAGKTPRTIDRRTREIALTNNVVLPEKKSRLLTINDLEKSELIVVMNEDNFWFIKSLNPNITGDKLRLLMEFSKQLAVRELGDPLQGEISYSEAFRLASKAVAELFNKVCSSYNLQ